MIEEYLISEGYVNDYASAQKIVEVMSDAWYDMICEASAAEVPWRERRGNRPSPSSRAATRMAEISRRVNEITRGVRRGDSSKENARFKKIKIAINNLNQKNPVEKTRGMTGKRGSQEGGKPQTNRGGMTVTGGVISANRPSQQRNLANAATDATGISHNTTSTGKPLRSLASPRRTRDVNKVSRNLGTTTTQPGGTLPKF
jgi:hypothetical protein